MSICIHKYKSDFIKNLRTRLKSFDILNNDENNNLESNSQNEANSDLKRINNTFKFSDLIGELNDSPTVFTLININKLIPLPEIQDCSKMIDEQVIGNLLFLASPDEDDDNIRQCSFFVIGSIIQYFSQKISLLFQQNLIPLLTNSLSNSNDLFVSSIYFVINCLIHKSSEFQNSFYDVFEFDFLFQSAYRFINSPNNDKIVECFSSIAQNIGVYSEDDCLKLLQLFYLALAKKLTKKDRIDMNSYHFALLGIINFLNNEEIPSDIKKSVVEDSNVSFYLQFFFECNELTPEIINASIIASQLYSLNVPIIPDILPKLLRIFNLSSLNEHYHIIINCIDIIIQLCSDDIFWKLINEENLIEVIFNIMEGSNVKTKIKIYSCFNSIISRMPKDQYVMIINDDFIGFLFNLIEIDDPDFTKKIIADIYNIFCVAEEIGELHTILLVLVNLKPFSGKYLIENIVQNQKIGEDSLSYLHYIYDTIVENEEMYE